ncbi:N-acetylmuramoyl-L-alanine amidase [Paenibacillus sp. CMAA1364]
MAYEGFVIHHSLCSSINGKGYDFWIRKDATVFAVPDTTDTKYIHICLDGNFNMAYELMSADAKHQLFEASKLIIRLSTVYRISSLNIHPHTQVCPGSNFPWNQLVIFPADMYH